MGLIRTSIFFWALLFVPALLFANGTIETDFPGFDIFEKVSGDLNADGYQDYAATIWKKGDRDAPIVIYFSDSGGRFKLGIKAMSANCHGCGGMKGNPEGPVGNIQIKNGILITTFLGGSRNYWTDLYKWRFDKKKNAFTLIGETFTSEDTVGNDPLERTDTNFSMGKIESSVGKKRKTCWFKKKPVYLSTFNFDHHQPVTGCPSNKK